MKTKILLIVLPQTELGQRLFTATPSNQECMLLSKWRNSAYEVECLDAEKARLTLFEIVRETRRRAPHYVWIKRPADGTASTLSLMLTAILVDMLRAALPNMDILDEPEDFDAELDLCRTFSTTMSPIKSTLQNTYHGKTSASGDSTSGSSHYTSWYR